jgi:cold shock CspA family protein/ribosome-associated translation inhibitor RaiA
MQTPLEIAFHNLQPSPSLETEIRERVAKLERIYDRLVGCRVSVEGLHKQHRTGNIYEVHIEMQVPGPDLVVSRTPHKPKERYANPDVRTSLRDAFEAAERQLKDFKAQQRGDVKMHEPLFLGQISEIDPKGEYGFLLTKEGAQLYFHRNSVLDNGYEKLRRGTPVHYIEATGDTGPTASKVWIATENERE